MMPIRRSNIPETIWNAKQNSTDYTTDNFSQVDNQCSIQDYDIVPDEPSDISLQSQDRNWPEAVDLCDNTPKGIDFYGSLNGYNPAEFNSKLRQDVEEAGWGTREAVLAAAWDLCYVFPSITGYKYYYTPPGDNTHNGYAHALGLSENTYLDCRAFIQWILYNAGYDVAEALEYIGDNGVGRIADSTNLTNLSADEVSNLIKPGDIFSTPGDGHIWLVVAVTEDGYYAAEESAGAEINFYSFDNPTGEYPNALLYDMSEFYDNPDNVRRHNYNNGQVTVE